MNHIDENINEIISAYQAEAERGNFSRNVQEQVRRIKEMLANHNKRELLGSGYWGSLKDNERLEVVRDAVLELVVDVAKLISDVNSAKAVRPSPVESGPVESEPAQLDIEDAPPPKKRKPRKAKA